jgi:anti-sigma regulatory factor (Ser/Thr protein kinase)
MEAFTLPIRVKNRLEELPVLCRAVDTLNTKVNLSRRKCCEIQLVLEEIFSNIVNHGFADKREHDIDITITFQKDLLTIRFEDDGKAFDPTDAPCPDTRCAIERRLVGGLGVHFVKHFIDTCSYRREKDKNIMILKKQLTGPAGIEPTPPKH